MELINKSALVAEIEGERKFYLDKEEYDFGWNNALDKILSFIDTLEVKDTYEQCVQNDSIKAGIRAHAETYSFNIESILFQQLSKEQQKLWRKEIEQAYKAGAEWYASHNTKQPDNLLLAARKASIAMCDYDEKYLDEYPYDSIAEQKFIEGANWQKEQLKAKDEAKDEAKEVEFEKEWKEYFKYRGDVATVNIKHLAKHFFELGLQVNNPITAADRGMAEEIVINLKRVEQDYHLDLTREMEWLRNKTNKI